MRSHDVLCHSVIERVILSASDSLDHCTQVVKFQEDYMKSLAWTLHACFQKLVLDHSLIIHESEALILSAYLGSQNS